MQYKIKILFIFFILGIFQQSYAQNNRLNTSNNIGWYNYFGTVKLTSKFGIHSEYQWRRNNFITDGQQSLLRIGVNYQLKPNILLRAGYGWIETYPYGEVSINAFGKSFTEHRVFEMAQLSQKEGIVDISHRFMLEQRFVGKYSSANTIKQDAFPLLHRMRYMARLSLPLKCKETKNKSPYLVLYDEIFIGFGKNVNANVFDQNRIGVLMGYRYNNNFRIEAGFLNQTIQLGRQINAQNIFQNNNGIIVNSIFNFDLSKRIK